MAVAFNAATTAIGQDTDLVMPHTPAGQNRSLWFVIAYLDLLGVGADMAPPTFAGNALTKVGNDQFAGLTTLSMWRLTAPPAALGSLVTSFTTLVNYVAEVVSYNGAHQTVPIGTPVVTNGAGLEVGLTVPGTVEGSMVLEGVGVDLGTTNVTATIHGGQNQRQNAQFGASGFRVRLASSDDDGGGDVNMAWTLSGSRPWIQKGVEIKPAPASGLPVTGRSGGLAGMKRLGRTRGQG